MTIPANLMMPVLLIIITMYYQPHSSQVHGPRTEASRIRHRHRNTWHRGNRESEFDRLTQQIVQLFRHQRLAGEYQYAVLVLLPNMGTARNPSLQTGTGASQTNLNNTTFLSNVNLCSFMTARPDGSTHAETSLMACLAPLMRN